MELPIFPLRDKNKIYIEHCTQHNKTKRTLTTNIAFFSEMLYNYRKNGLSVHLQISRIQFNFCLSIYLKSYNWFEKNQYKQCRSKCPIYYLFFHSI